MKKGFSLIELMVVVAILATLIAVTIPMFKKIFNPHPEMSYVCSPDQQERIQRLIEECMVENAAEYMYIDHAKKRCTKVAKSIACKKVERTVQEPVEMEGL